MKRSYYLWVALSLFLLTGCRTAVYSAWEKVGVYKRDLLKKAVVEARDEQEQAALRILMNAMNVSRGERESRLDNSNLS